MNTLIIEDEYPAAERLEKLILKTDPMIKIVGVLESVEAAVAWLKNNAAPDLIFSDIQLSDGLSFEIFEQITVTSPIIFTTSYDQYAIKAFKVRSIDYLLKPIKPLELAQALRKYQDLREQKGESNLPNPQYAFQLERLLEQLQPTPKKYKNRFLVEQHEQLLPIQTDQIAYFFTTNELLCLVRQDGKQFLIDYTLEELEKCLDPAIFFRLNRQFIAHLEAIRQINQYFNGKLKLQLHPPCSQEVIVSREKAQIFKNWIEGN